MTLLEEVSSFQNLYEAYHECAKRKRSSMGFQKSRFNIGEGLVELSEQLRSNSYQWGPYREFYVCDPKRRLIMAAPYMCRVVHHAIHRVILPYLDVYLSDSVFACREGRGNRFASQLLFRRLKILGPQRYTLKLDISQYFPSINHAQLLKQLEAHLPDDSLHHLLVSLLASHPGYAQRGYGIPIGNLTSQLFANFYLRQVDQFACEGLSVPYHWLSEAELKADAFYIRYMDDMILLADKKEKVCEVADRIVREITPELGLSIPMRKRMHIASDPIPFLGYVMDHDSVRPLARNARKIKQKIARMERENQRPSLIAQVRNSYEAWIDLEEEGG
ncbi:reverse transcriptase domain-containing protein [Bdellovibrio sp.]|uniref:reverse transcriptase domain-containing protein n=1 Tax=Bdellovibrio sp. TaxID=28201 RepID=UPI0039E2C61E